MKFSSLILVTNFHQTLSLDFGNVIYNPKENKISNEPSWYRGPRQKSYNEINKNLLPLKAVSPSSNQESHIQRIPPRKKLNSSPTTKLRMMSTPYEKQQTSYDNNGFQNAHQSPGRNSNQDWYNKRNSAKPFETSPQNIKQGSDDSGIPSNYKSYNQPTTKLRMITTPPEGQQTPNNKNHVQNKNQSPGQNSNQDWYAKRNSAKPIDTEPKNQKPESHVMKIPPRKKRNETPYQKNKYYLPHEDQDEGQPHASPLRDSRGCGTNDVPRSSPSSKDNIVSEAKKFTYLAGASYCVDPSIESWDCMHCKKTKGMEFIKTIYVSDYDLRAIIVVDNENKDLIISFRGSNSFSQAISLVSFSTELYVNMRDIRVQNEFKSRSNAIFKELTIFLHPIIKDYHCYRKVLVGHSLGGALAVLTATQMRHTFNIPYSDMAVYTYGQPRVGNFNFASWYRDLGIHTIRVVNGRDSIPHSLPYPEFFHSGRELFIYDGDILCSDSLNEDDRCSNQFSMHSLSYYTHNTAWGIEMGGVYC